MSARNGIIYKNLPVGYNENDEPIIEKIGFSFSLNFWNELCRLEKIKIDEIGSLFVPNPNLLETYINVLYCAAMAYCEVRDVDFSFKRKMAGEWISSMEQEDFNEIIEAMAESRIFGKNLSGLRVNKETKAA